MRTPESKLVPFSKLTDLSMELRGDGQSIVTTNGCFDLIHAGHIKYLFEARRLGDCLICAVNSDRSVKALKGSSRPIHSQKARALQVAALEAVDYVTVFDQDTPHEFLKRIRPHLHVKGGDYDLNSLPERELVESLGGEVKLLPLLEGYSTTGILESLAEKGSH